MANKYHCNDLMRLIGKQHVNKIVDNSIYNDIMSIAESNIAHESTFDMMLVDVFVYGYIMGKRADRKKEE